MINRLYELDEPGKYFEVKRIGDLVAILCVPKPLSRNQSPKPARIILPINKPYRLNDIFTKLRLRQRVF